MPRLFPSLGRSKKPRDRAHDEYPVYEDYGRYEQYAQPSQAPAWRTVTPQVDSRNHHDSVCLLSFFVVRDYISLLTLS